MKKINLSYLAIIILIIIIILLIILCSLLKKEDNNTINNPEVYKENYKDIQLKEKYECNEFSFKTITTEDLIKIYLNDYKDNMLNNLEKAYNSLNTEYKEKRFENIDKYRDYIEKNIEEIEQIKLNRYLINNYDEYQEYICEDQFGNFYIFEVTAVMEYNVKLDSYRVLSIKNLEDYQKLTDIKKVGYNIQRCIDAINQKDYAFVYNKLDNTFKGNNYRTEEMFANFIKNNLYAKNEVEQNVETSNEGEVYIYNITIKNSENNSENKKMTVIMQLKESTDFTMSFSMQ